VRPVVSSSAGSGTDVRGSTGIALVKMRGGTASRILGDVHHGLVGTPSRSAPASACTSLPRGGSASWSCTPG